ncbi:TPA: WbqC family protein [Legionella pneumophila]
MKGMISQPRYLPTFNYLQRIYQSEIFVILDDVQHQRRCVEHRNKIINNDKEFWLSIPIERKKTSRPLIQDMIIQSDFIEEHHLMIKQAYSKCRYYEDDLFKRIYNMQQLSFVAFFQASLKNIFDLFNLKMPEIILSSTLNTESTGSKKLADICNKTGINLYISGPNGRNYLNGSDFHNTQILFHDFLFPTYSQTSKVFIPWLCWLDGYFNEGREFVYKQITNPMRLVN